MLSALMEMRLATCRDAGPSAMEVLGGRTASLGNAQTTYPEPRVSGAALILRSGALCRVRRAEPACCPVASLPTTQQSATS